MIRRWFVLSGLLIATGCDKKTDDADSGSSPYAGSAAKTETASRLRQLGMAVQFYRDSYGRPLPVSGKLRSEPECPEYSWRVLILPFIEQNNQFTMMMSSRTPPTTREGMPGFFRKPGSRNEKAGLAYFRRVKGEGPRWDGVVAVVETTEGVPWAMPGDDLTIKVGQPLPKLGGNFAGGYLALSGNGRVLFLSNDMEPKALEEALLTGAGALEFSLPPVDASMVNGVPMPAGIDSRATVDAPISSKPVRPTKPTAMPGWKESPKETIK